MVSLANSEPFESFFDHVERPAGARPGLSEDCMTGEPTLEELLAEPIARLLMARDRVDPDLLEELVRRRFA
ncbi:hypothetical protein [Jiella sonneratiae]|uniref:Uncharacterized protein n=1 Tax=Jiella sonneratiae TaxID=2816856 RepID=A0ABS3IY24_9HYPH|nr:hypothetical protein [Jiella sonneratiae]MBO0902298.1 hypothetical protein [Jiella sonneratiae]